MEIVEDHTSRPRRIYLRAGSRQFQLKLTKFALFPVVEYPQLLKTGFHPPPPKRLAVNEEVLCFRVLRVGWVVGVFREGVAGWFVSWG